MCAVLGLWIVHVILGFNQNWLEMPLMLCHTAARGFIVGGQWEEHHSLPGVNTACLPDVVRYFHLKFMSFVLVPVGSLCEMEAVFAWVHVWWIVWRGEIRSFWNQLFLEPRGTAYGKGRDCVTLHPHWCFAHGCDCSSPSANRVWWAPFVGYPGFFPGVSRSKAPRDGSALALLQATKAQSLFWRGNLCTSLLGTACGPHSHSAAASQSSENLSSCLSWKLGMNLPRAGLLVLCSSAGVQIERRGGFAEGDWEGA